MCVRLDGEAGVVEMEIIISSEEPAYIGKDTLRELRSQFKMLK